MDNTSGNKMMEMLGWLHCPPWSMLVMAALLMGLAPFWPEPHLVEKAHMLLNGESLRPIDWFDIVWHSWPLIWIALRLATPSAAGYCPVPTPKTPERRS
ncbi:MAG TPA: hypothetical protein VNH42_00390 [Mariprofundaceae bacterium]|nr:hypothetical protein [Mariprofundaceae bacterium]